MSAPCIDCKRDILIDEDPTDGRCDSCDREHVAGLAETPAPAADKPKRKRPSRRAAGKD